MRREGRQRRNGVEKTEEEDQGKGKDAQEDLDRDNTENGSTVELKKN